MHAGHGRGRRSATALLAALALTATACGARLEPEVHDEAVGQLAAAGATIVTGEGGVAAGSEAGDASTSTGSTGAAAGGGTASGGGATVGQGGAATTGGGPTGTTGGGTTGGSGPSTGSAGATSTGGATGGGPDTRSMPAGGNGGATDIGVFEDRIVIGNAVDNAGAVPGIFLDAQLATRAFVAWFTATEGTIYGRQLVLDARDSRLDAGANREIYLDFCESAFAAVGSMSAFDEGVAGPARDCGIPDIRSAVVNPVTMEVPNIFSSDAISATLFPTNQFLYWDETYPGAKDAAAMLYIDNDTTKKQSRLMISATDNIGFNWVVDRAIGLAETNYSSYVIDLKQKGARFVFFQGDAPQAVRLAKAMRQQSYWPDVFALQQNLYKPALIQQGGVDVEGIELSIGSVMNENIQHHPELQTYRQWLKQVDPQAEPTGQGAYSWGAGLLLVDALKAMGPEVTRAKLVEHLRGVHDFTGNGLFPPQDVGRKVPSNCHIMAKVEGGRFVPTDPPGGRTFNCRGKAEPGSIEG